MFYLDLDGFKGVNDNLGHLAGDQVLAQMAGRITQSVRESDTVARMGGDEFTILLENLESRHRAGELARAILANVARPFRLGATEVRLSASIGISFYPEDETDPDRLISCADSAMYEAKRSGKNSFALASPGGAGDRPFLAAQIPEV